MVRKVRTEHGVKWLNQRGFLVLKLDDDTAIASCIRLRATVSDLEDLIEACQQAITEMKGVSNGGS